MENKKLIEFNKILSKQAPPFRDRGELARGKYDFAIAYPDPDSLPIDGLVSALKEGLSDEGSDLALYPDVQGYGPLREYVSHKLKRDRAMKVDPEQIVLGDGSSQHIATIIDLLIDPGDAVITEDFCYSNTLTKLRISGAEVHGILCDDSGMKPDNLEMVIADLVAQDKRPKLIYTIPTFQNPQGWTMTLESRKALLDIASFYEIPILEDDCYVDLRFEGDNVPAIHSLDLTGQVMYVGSFSKTIAPGLRMGYFVGPEEIIGRFRMVRKISGSGVNEFAALAIHRYAMSGLDDHVAKILKIQRDRRDTMIATLGEMFGSNAKWSTPEGGLYLWLEMPHSADLTEITGEALNAGVGYQPGPMFAADASSGHNYARLCFGYNSSEEIGRGIEVLSDLFTQKGFF